MSSSAPPPKRPDSPPTSRWGRLARLGALAPRALPLAQAAVKRAIRGKPDPEAAAEERRKISEEAKKTAKAMLKTLGEMKGLPLKLGQMASYIEGLAPPGYEEKFKETLKKLQAKAPPLSPEAAIRVVTEEELGAPPDKVYAEWEREPFAAASIGQVHRATTKSGDQVAVKVQYPGIDVAIKNDLKSVSLIESMVAPIGRRYGAKDAVDEIRTVFMRELDYTLEAEAQDLFRRIHADDDDIVIPEVFHSLTTKRVLTTTMLGGTDYSNFCATASQEDRDAAGQTIWRFMFRALWKHGMLYADPHPGNYRFLGGGRVGFLDFGCHKQVPSDLIAGEKRIFIAMQEGNKDELTQACAEVLGYNPDDKETFELYVAYTKMICSPIVEDTVFEFSPKFAREAVAYLVRGSRKIIFKEGDSLPTLPKSMKMPRDHTFMNRLQWGLSSVMGGLRTRANFRRITDPWIHGPVVPV